MSLTAKFTADFQSFYDAVQKAELQLDKLTGGADKTGAALTRMVKDFSGQKLIQEAQLATKAVEDIGGATALTQKEQARVNALVNEAIAKYAVLGQEAPADMVALAKATKGAEKASSDIVGTLGKVAGAVGIGFSIGAVVSFGKSVFETAGHIQDLSQQMGISTDAVQGFKEAAEVAGSSLDAVGAALTKMNDNLATGDKSTVKALSDLGLKFSDIRQLSPEDAFLAITDAIQKIPDPMDQSRLAIELFGKRGAELLPAIKNGFRDVSDAASKMSADTIQALDDAGDAWQRLYNKVVIVSGNLIAATEHTVSGVVSNFKKFAQTAAEQGLLVAGTVAAAVDQMKNLPAHPDINLPATAPVPPKTKDELEAIEKHMKTIADLRDRIFGRDAQQAALNYTEALGGVANLSKVSAQEQKKINEAIGEALDVYKRFGKTAPQAMRDLFIATTEMPPVIDGLTQGFENVGVKLDNFVIPKTADFGYALNYIGGIPFGVQVGKQVDLVPPKVKLVSATIGDLSQALAQLAQVSGGTFGGMVSSLSTLVAAANTAFKSIELIKSSASEKKGFTAFLDMASGISGIVSAAIAAGKAVASLFGLFDRNKGRDVVVDFAKTFGGFDELHKQLLTLGEAGEALWIKLTQGVGRNNPEQARKVIEEIEEALRKQKEASEQAGSSTEEQAQATIETATEAQKALEELAPKIKENEDLWKEWGGIVTGQIDAIAKGLRSLNLPSPSGGGYLGAPEGGGTIDVHSTIVLDGRVAAESVAETLLG